MPRAKKLRQDFVRELISLNDNDCVPKKKSEEARKHKKKHHKIHKREVKENCNGTLVIKQKVKVKHQKHGCIINLTNICKHRSKENAKSKKKLQTKTKSSKVNSERIVPRCFRGCYDYEHKHSRNKKIKVKVNKKIKKKKVVKNEKRQLKLDFDSLSLISVSSLGSEPSSEQTFEDISSDSFTTISSEDDIEVLIKKTKEREKTSKDSFNSACLWETSTQYLESVSDTTFHASSELDHSLHSTATVVLATQSEIYSPTRLNSPDQYNTERNQNDFSRDCEDRSYEEQNYSPALSFCDKIGIENFNGIVSSNNFNHSCKIKQEPYSPSESPLCCNKSWPYEVPIKYEPHEMVSNNGDKTETTKTETPKVNHRILKVKRELHSPVDSDNALPNKLEDSSHKLVDIKS